MDSEQNAVISSPSPSPQKRSSLWDRSWFYPVILALAAVLTAGTVIAIESLPIERLFASRPAVVLLNESLVYLQISRFAMDHKGYNTQRAAAVLSETIDHTVNAYTKAGTVVLTSKKNAAVPAKDNITQQTIQTIIHQLQKTHASSSKPTS
jgi:hypothetical protein